MEAVCQQGSIRLRPGNVSPKDRNPEGGSLLMRKTTPVLAWLVVAGSVLAAPLGAASRFPERIPLPDGFRPEGIAIGNGPTFYVGSIPTGAIYRGNLRTGEGA